MKLFIVLMLFAVAAQATSEREYQEKHCTGLMEQVLPDRTRIDCETFNYAIEYDFAKKWAESIGQSLHYGRMTGKLPGIVLITETVKDCKHVKKAQDNIKHYWLPIRLQTVGPFKCDGF